MNWIKFSIVVFVFSAPVSAEMSNMKYGGKISMSFSNRKGPRASTGFLSGYSWIEADAELQNGEILRGSVGWSYEKARAGQILMNQITLSYKNEHHNITVGRSLNAAGLLHHDLSDFGAPALGIDNIPVSSLFAGSFSSNTAQQIAQPFANRLSYYVTPISWAAFGFSYAPYNPKDHPADYQYFTKSDHRHETSAAISVEQNYKNRFIGASFGVTHARYAHDENHYQSGDVMSRQMSFYLRHDIHKNRYNLYEFVWGCKDADNLNKDCNAGWQISEIEGRWTHHKAFKKRVHYKANYDDYSTGYMYRISDDTEIGFESILRIKQNKSLRDGALHWNFGISHQF